MKIIILIFVLGMAASAFADNCGKKAGYGQAIEELWIIDDFREGDLLNLKINNLQMVEAYTLNLEAKLEKNPARKKAMLEQAKTLCSTRD